MEFGSVPDSTWVVINVSGGIQQSWNPDCAYAPPYWPCQTGSVVPEFGSEPWDNGAVLMWAKEGSGLGSVRLRGSGGPNVSSAIGLHYFSTKGSFVGRVNAQAKYAWNPNTGTGPYSYNLAGGYIVDVMPVQSPIGITDSGVLDSTGMHQYTVRPLYGLQFINPLDFYWNPPAGSISWYFIPGDSVSEKPGFAEPYIGVPECQYQQTCNFAPPEPGRMQATAYVETRLATVRGSAAGWCDVSSLESVSEDAPVPPECEDKQFGGCPKVLSGKVISAGIRVGSILHTFKFGGPMERIEISRDNPAKYTIAHPATSTDGWWIADEGWISVRCAGIFYHVTENEDIWIGRAWYGGQADLHMSIGPSHP